MSEKKTMPYVEDYWDCLYNHKFICEALLHEGVHVACLLFKQHARRLLIMIDANATDKIEAIYIALTSLNRNLYAYIQFYLNISLAECCYECSTHAHSIIDDTSFISAGLKIIKSYSQNLKLNRDKYNDFQQVYTYIQNHLEENISLQKLCSILHVSKSCLCRLFKDLTGSTFCEYLKQQRLNRARIMLTSTNSSIDAIASACGFSSSAYFSTVFKGEFGIPPSMFRLKYQ